MLNTRIIGAVSTPPTFVEDVFSTQLYTGNGTTRTITNGIDLAGKGGLVWTKARSTTSAFNFSHGLFDTARGATRQLVTNNNTAEEIQSNALTGFLSTGYTLGADTNTGTVNNTSYGTQNYVSWTFREQAKFFDIVTYTGNDTTRNIAHSLGSVPGMMIIKRRSNAGYNWYVYHRSLGHTQTILLDNASGATGVINNDWGGQDPTSTTFRVGGANGNLNESGATYVAYLFAHNAGGFGTAGTDNVISCGSFTTNSSGVATVNLGYEPQYVMIKASSTTGNWLVEDVMRGLSQTKEQQLFANTSDAEGGNGPPNDITINATGFTTANSNVIGNSTTYIYVAIRRPMKTPTSGAEVFAADRYASGGGSGPVTGFVTDVQLLGQPASDKGYFSPRLTGSKAMQTNSTSAELDYTNLVWDRMNGAWNSNVTNYMLWGFRRATGFMDVVCYTGTGSARTVTHNLGVVPELMIVKDRNGGYNWAVYANNDNTDYLILNTTAATADDIAYWNDTSPTSTVFSVGTNNSVNGSGGLTYVAYLFATVAGVSKIGSYTGTGTTQTINCGFTAGARFVMIKRIDSTGDWYFWDYVRGIVSGNDPYILMNSSAAEVTNTDYIDPANSGFEISSTAPAAINANGGSFIFMAIA